MKKNDNIINNILLNQQKLLELFIIVIILAIGIALISNQLPSFFKIDPLTTIAIGILFCIIGIVFLIKQVLDNRKLIREYDGFFVYDEEKNSIIKIPEYQFSSDMIYCIGAVFLENINLKKIWDSKPLTRSSIHSYEQNSSKKRNAIKMINELTEYLILKKLSTHLIDYSNKKQIPKDVLKTYERVDIPDILLKNRFLEIISHPLDERPIFDHDRNLELAGSELIYSYGPHGAMYDKFDLVLPKNSTITKPNENEVLIETDKLRLFIRVDFEGSNTNMPSSFMNDCLSIEKDRELSNFSVFSVPITVKVDMKLRSLFSKTGLEYYEWVDSFTENLNNYISQKTFFKRINWDSVQTTMICIKNLQRVKQK